MKKTLKVEKSAELLKYLFEKLTDLNKTRIKQLLKFGCISIGDKVTTQFNYALKSGDEIRIETTKPLAESRMTEAGLEVIYEDKVLIAISKPAGLLSIATDKIQSETAIAALNNHVSTRVGGEWQSAQDQKSVYIIHRLDRDVSGVMLFAKSEETKKTLQSNWSHFTKEYLTIVEGRPPQSADTLVSYLLENKILRVISGPERPGARRAETYYEVVQAKGNYTLLKVKLGSGRKHQIRVHLSDMGCPVTGDKNYGAKTNPLKRIALHACSLKLTHPTTGKPLEITSPAPGAFKGLINKG